MSTERKTVIITGASQGIGAGLVAAYRAKGYNVVATSRSIKPSSQEGVVTVAGDIGEPATAQKVVEAALSHFGRIDSLINNAGIFTGKPFTDFTEEDFRANISTNVAGFFFITQRAVAEMLKKGSGHVVTITTSLVDVPTSAVPTALANLTKGGLVSATRELAIEYAKRGIRFNAVSPGIIKTPMHAPETHSFLDALHPVGHMGEVEDIVGAVLYLENASFVTGEILHVDGGQSAGR